MTPPRRAIKGKKKKSDTGFGCGCLLAIVVGSTVVNSLFYYLFRGESPWTWEAVQDVQDSRAAWTEYALEVWVLPPRWIAWALVGLTLSLFLVWLLSSRRSIFRVYALVLERIFALGYGFAAAIFFSQLFVYSTAFAYAQIFLFPDPRFTGRLKAVFALPLYVVLALSFASLVFLVLRDSVWRSLVLNGLILRHYAAASWRRLSPRQLEPARILESFEPSDLLVISDPHLTVPGAATIESGGQGGSGNLLTRLLSSNPKAFLFPGDLTDTGTSADWERVGQELARVRAPMFIIPGNHDVHFRRLSFQRGRLKEFLRQSLSLSPIFENSSSYSEDLLLKHMSEASGQAQGGFPRLESVPGLDLDLLLLNSNRRLSNSPVTNAIGYVGDDQLASGERLLASRRGSDSLLAFVLHHHVVSVRLAPVSSIFLTCLDAIRVLDLAERYRAVAIIHGHLHMPYMYEHRYGADKSSVMKVISCGSVSFAAAGPLAKQVGSASAVGIDIAGGTISAVKIYTPAVFPP